MICLDMDGVLCDFIGAAFRAHGQKFDVNTYPGGEWNCENVIGVTTDEFWRRIDAVGMPFWMELKPYSWADELVLLCESFDAVKIATSPSRSHVSPAGKVLWLERHFMGNYANPKKYNMGADKSALAKPGVVLVDDNDKNVEGFRAAGGEAVLVPQPWNSMHDVRWRTGAAKLQWVREELTRLCEAKAA